MKLISTKRCWAYGAFIIVASHLLLFNSPTICNLNKRDTPTAGSIDAPENLKMNLTIVVDTNTDVIKDLLKNEIFPRLERIRKICGPLCEVDSATKLAALTVKTSDSETMLLSIRTPVDCRAILKSEDIDAGEKSVPYPLPEELHSLYSLNGSVEIVHWKRLSSVYLGEGGKSNSWTEEKMNKIIFELKNGNHSGTYGIGETNRALHYLNITGKILGSRVLIIGTEFPWLEAICLMLGAKEIVTLEYGKIVSTHPKIKTLTPPEFRREYLDGKLGLFDTVASYSSVEHSGLGRYGDALNPWGDLLAVARSWCVTRPGGALVLSLPTGMDKVVMNAHRIYGRFRWPLVAANWKQVDSHLHDASELNNAGHQGSSQPVFVFEKLDGNE